MPRQNGLLRRTVVTMIGLALARPATAQPISSDQIATILASPDRTAADRTNDLRRKPQQMLEFFALRPGLVAVDLSAAGGYTTELVARAIGPTGELARTTLYRYTDGISRLLYGNRTDIGQPSPAVIEGLRIDLRQQVAELAADPVAVATIAGRLEVLLRSGDDLLRTAPPPGLKWCRPILVALLMAGLGLLSLLTPPRVRSAILLTGLATLLSLGMFFLEEIANPFRGSFSVSQAIFDEALFTIAN